MLRTGHKLIRTLIIALLATVNITSLAASPQEVTLPAYVRIVSDEGDPDEYIIPDSLFYEISGKTIFKVNKTILNEADPFVIELAEKVLPLANAKGWQLEAIELRGAASPEGPYLNNIRLSIGRAQALRDYMTAHLDYVNLGELTTTNTIAEDYPYLLWLLERADGTPLEEKHTTFGVWAIKFPMGAPQLVMQHTDGTAYLTRYEEEATEYGSHWNYELTVGSHEQYIKYWDLSCVEYRFAGYAPYFTDAEQTVPADVSVNMMSGSMQIPSIHGHLGLTEGIDWCVTLHVRDNAMGPNPASEYDAIEDPNGAARTTIAEGLTAKVPLTFHRILSVVEFRIANSADAEVDIESVSVKVVDKSLQPDAIITTADYSGTWTNQSDPVTEVASKENFTVGSTPVTFGETLEIPQNVGERYFQVTIKISDTQTITQTFPIPSDWESEKKYIYTIKFSLEDLSIILATVTVDSWEYGGEDDEEQTNW